MIIDVPKGFTFSDAFLFAKGYFTDHPVSFVEFDFNGINISVDRNSVFCDIAQIYDLKCKICRLEAK